jgi:NAD(P)-dependent dehydrogenase (short-subunit alcohol dehydrogenase family)
MIKGMTEMDASKLMFKDGLMKGERILVTGGGTGLGKEMAEAFLKLGAEVVICGRRGDVLEETARELTDRRGGHVMPIPCDIRSSEAISEMLDDVWRQGPLTGLVNNAAGNFISRTQDLSPRGFEAISNIVFRGSFYMTLDVGKRWIAEKRPGSIISILATFVWNGAPYMVPSAMSKAGVNAMTQSLAVEWARYGIRCNAICPGPFPTPGMSDRLNPQIGDKARDDGGAGIPMGRVGEMHELCNLAILLMGPGAEYINGETIAIDGGGFLQGGAARQAGWTDEQWAAARDSIRATNEKDRVKRTV